VQAKDGLQFTNLKQIELTESEREIVEVAFFRVAKTVNSTKIELLVALDESSLTKLCEAEIPSKDLRLNWSPDSRSLHVFSQGSREYVRISCGKALKEFIEGSNNTINL